MRVIPRETRFTIDEVAYMMEARSLNISLKCIADQFSVSVKRIENVLGNAKRFGFEHFHSKIVVEKIR